MVLETQIKKAEDAVDKYGNDITVETSTKSSDTDDWGEPVYSSPTTRTFRGVVDQFNSSLFEYTNAGRVRVSDMIVIAKKEESFDADVDVIIWQNKRYKIQMITPTIVDNIVRLYELRLVSE